MSRRARRLSIVVGLALACAAIVGLARADGVSGPGATSPGSDTPDQGSDADGPVSVYDRGIGDVVEMDLATVEAEQARASRAPGYRDADGNPRYILVWENGTLVPGPPLACTQAPGQPRDCTLTEPGPAPG
jgi:hypothetical protein